jgi:5-methylcytosine-specific restriction endonuclease McrA
MVEPITGLLVIGAAAVLSKLFGRKKHQAPPKRRTDNKSVLHSAGSQRQRTSSTGAAPWINYMGYMHSSAWYARRDAVIKRDGGRCKKCGSTDRPQAHHLHYKTFGNEPPPYSELITLCKPCHDKADVARRKQAYS